MLDKVFKNGPSKICGRPPLKNFTWSIFEYLDPYDTNSKNNKFDFPLVTKDHVISLIKNLDASKTGQKMNIPTSINKKKFDIFSDVLQRNINKYISEFKFPDDLKLLKLSQYR